jgi:hypothetical protein
LGHGFRLRDFEGNTGLVASANRLGVGTVSGNELADVARATGLDIANRRNVNVVVAGVDNYSSMRLRVQRCVVIAVRRGGFGRCRG